MYEKNKMKLGAAFATPGDVCMAAGSVAAGSTRNRWNRRTESWESEPNCLYGSNSRQLGSTIRVVPERFRAVRTENL